MGVSGSSGRLKQTFGRGPVKIDSQLLWFNRLPRVTGVRFHGSHTIACRRAVPNRQRPASARLRTMPWLHQANVHPFRCHAPAKHLRAMLGIRFAASLLLWLCHCDCCCLISHSELFIKAPVDCVTRMTTSDAGSPSDWNTTFSMSEF